MLTDLIYYLTFYLILPAIYICITGPFETLIHELAHALTSRILTKQPVQVYLGIIPQDDEVFHPLMKRPHTLVFTLAGITFHLKPFSGPVGFAHWEPVDEHELWTYLAGPLASLLLAIIFSVTTYFARSHTFSIWYYINEVTAIAAFLQFVVTLLPIRYPSWWWLYAGYPSDGYQVLHILRSRRQTMVMP
ncbi:MAG: hypothetical protein NVS4B12_16210 [Ktedonobacteraceae bacterium]